MAAHGKIGETMRKAVQRVQHAGKGGDTRLAHVNPAEEKMLKASGGSGKINKKTGLKSFEGGREDLNIQDRTRSRVTNIPGARGDATFIRNVAPKRTIATSVVGAASPGVSKFVLGGRHGGFGFFKTPEKTTVPATIAPKVAAPKTVSKPAVPAVPAKTSPIARSIVGAINQSSGNTGSQTINETAVQRAKRAGTTRDDLVFTFNKTPLTVIG